MARILSLNWTETRGVDCSEIVGSGCTSVIAEVKAIGRVIPPVLCGDRGRPIPSASGGVVRFRGIPVQQGLSSSATKMHLAAVRQAPISLGVGDLSLSAMPQLQYVVKGTEQLLAGRPRWVISVAGRAQHISPISRRHGQRWRSCIFPLGTMPLISAPIAIWDWRTCVVCVCT